MEHSEFIKLKAELTAGDTRGLATIFQTHISYCIGKLQYQHQCSREDAEDIYIEAILNFREKVVNGKIDAVAECADVVIQRDQHIARVANSGDKHDVVLLSPFEQIRLWGKVLLEYPSIAERVRGVDVEAVRQLDGRQIVDLR